MKSIGEEADGADFDSHGPATLPDFTWWSGLTVADARTGIELAGPRLEQEVVDGQAHWFAAAAPAPGKRPAASPASPAAYLLPAFDEYTVAYRDRSAVLDPARGGLVSTSNCALIPLVTGAKWRVRIRWK